MTSDFSKKLFIFISVVFLLLMMGPYFGIHPLGAPSLPANVTEHSRRLVTKPSLILSDEDAMDAMSNNSPSQLSDEPDIVDDVQNKETHGQNK